MNNSLDIQSVSKSEKPHVFFEKQLDNDLEKLSKFLQHQYKKIESGEIVKGELNDSSAWDSSGSISTINWNKFNVFQFYSKEIHSLYSALRDMVLEACDYYDIDFKKEQYMVQGWFNINYKNNGKLDWHDHAPSGAPFFHGYYCVNAEPSITYYKIFNKDFTNINKNNRAILSETGHPHAMGDWDWDGPRITIAYDIIPLSQISRHWEQHWIPLV